MLPPGVCSVERVAEQLGVDRRTVHRHLEQHGENHSRVVNAMRVDLAT